MNLLITGAWKEGRAYQAELEAMGHTIWLQQKETEALVCPAEEIEGVICNGLFLYHPIEQFTSLRYIQLTSAGYDRVPMELVREREIEIHNAKDVYSIPMAEFAVGGVLQLYKKFAVFRDNQKQHRWEKQRDLLELAGKTVCIIGCGSVGKACAKRFSAFDAKVIGITAHPRPIQWFDSVHGMDELENVLKSSDIVVLAVPLTDETKHLISAERIGMMKQTAVLVNIARGEIVDTEKLIDALENDCLAGAVLDVVEAEPLVKNSRLWEIENVVITPHNSFVGEENDLRLKNVIYQNLYQM